MAFPELPGRMTSRVIRAHLRRLRALAVALAVASFGLVGVASTPAGATDPGIDWTARSAAEANSWYAVAYGDGLFVAVAGDGTNRVMTSPDGITWTPRVVGSFGWRSVTYGAGVFVAVGLSGGVTTSPDGITWTPRTASESNGWTSVTFGGGLFVAVSNDGTNQVMTSPDGITWTARAATEANVWTSVAFGNGVFVAVAGSGSFRVMTSPDGFDWTAGTSAAGVGALSEVTFGEGLFVAVASNGTNRVMTSPDGITWTARAAAEANDWSSLTYGGGVFVAVSSDGTNRVMTSPDGITWTARAAAEEDNSWYSMAYGAGVFVAVAYTGTNRVMTSGILGVVVPGVPTNVVGTAGDQQVSVSFDAPEFVGDTPITGYTVTASPGGASASGASSPIVVGGLTNGTTYTFTVHATNGGGDGLESDPSAEATPPIVVGAWTKRTAAEVNTWASVTHGAGVFVAVAEDGTNRVMTSPDGIAWTPQVAAEANTWYSVTYGGGQFVAVASDGANRVMTSPDGVTWTSRVAAEANGWESVAYGGGVFVAVAWNGTNRVMTSPDGVTWTPRAAAEANDWRSVSYGGDVFVAVANTGTNRVMTSPDGVTWTPRVAAEATDWASVTYGGGLFVAVTYNGTNRVMSSPDGITWTPRVAAEASSWDSVTYGGGLFVAVAQSGTNRVMTSPDAITWTAQAAAEASGWTSVAFGNGMFVAVAEGGSSQVMTSPSVPGTLIALTPSRILDTRFDNGLSGAFAPQATRELTVTGVGGVPASGVDAVILNVTATAPTAGGWLTLFPAGESLPTASNLNFSAGQTVPNLVVVKVGTGGQVSINNTGGNAAAGTVQVIADVVGYYGDEYLPEDARFTGLTPTRILDSRFDDGLPGPFAPQGTQDLQVGGEGGVPVDADAVVLNMTATAPTAGGWLTVFPAGDALPTASNLNFSAGQTVPNLVTVKLGTTAGNEGKVSINNTGGNAAAGTVQVIADVVGYYKVDVGTYLTGIAPQRILDTRFGTGGVTGPVAGQDTIEVDPQTATGLPAVGEYSAVVVNVTVTAPSANGWLTVFPSDASLPTASNLNFVAGQTVPNLVKIAVGPDGKFKINNTGGNPGAGTVQIIADIVGYYT